VSGALEILSHEQLSACLSVLDGIGLLMSWERGKAGLDLELPERSSFVAYA